MANNTLIAAIVIIAVIVIGALAAVTMFQPQGPNTATATGDKSTKLAFNNNGTTWLQMDIIFENMTAKNGSKESYHCEVFIKPNDTAIIDLSNLAGYGNEKLPAGTTIRILAWKGLFNETVNPSTANLNLNMQGWSNTQNPGPTDTILNVQYPNLPVLKLPANITNTTVIILNEKDLSTLLSGKSINGTLNGKQAQIGPEILLFDNDGDETLYEEELLTVNSDGKVIITLVKTPELCSLFGGSRI